MELRFGFNQFHRHESKVGGHDNSRIYGSKVPNRSKQKVPTP